MNEGDVVIVFSQFGEVVDFYLVRNKITGESKGYGFLCYEDQRSTILAVDNFNNADICGQKLRVDHVKKYKTPMDLLKKLDLKDPKITEDMIYRPSGNDGRGWGKYRKVTNEEVFK